MFVTQRNPVSKIQTKPKQQPLLEDTIIPTKVTLKIATTREMVKDQGVSLGAGATFVLWPFDGLDRATQLLLTFDGFQGRAIEKLLYSAVGWARNTSSLELRSEPPWIATTSRVAPLVQAREIVQLPVISRSKHHLVV